MNDKTKEPPATDGQIHARLIELSAIATEAIGKDSVASVFIGKYSKRLRFCVEVLDFAPNNTPIGVGFTLEEAIAQAGAEYRLQKRRMEIEARVKAELEATT